MIDLLYRSFAITGAERLAWKLSSDRLRILCYHGICEDRLAGQPWLPSYFVTQSAFARQLAYLQRHATVLPLSDAVARLQSNTLPPNAVSLTFDDGYGNNLHQAMPLLQKYRTPASVFLSTSYVESGDWYPFLKLKLARLANPGAMLPDYKTSPVDEVMHAVAPYWTDVERRLTPDQRDTLRPMTIAEVRAADPAVIDFGGHSHSHAIARNEDPDRRTREVTASVRKVTEWTGRAVRTYSYPNGLAGDFGPIEKQALRDEGVDIAVTGIAGANRGPFDPLELKRYPLTVHHDDWRFRAEVTGFRTLLLSVTEGRPQ